MIMDMISSRDCRVIGPFDLPLGIILPPSSQTEAQWQFNRVPAWTWRGI